MISLSCLADNPHVRLRIGAEVGGRLEQHGTHLSLVAQQEEHTIALMPYRPGLDAVGAQLEKGATRDALRDAVVGVGDATVAAQFLGLLDRMSYHGMLDFDLVGEDGTLLATLLPQTEEYLFRMATLEDRESLAWSRFALLRREEQELILEAPLATGVFHLHDERCANLWFALARGCRVRQLLQSYPAPLRGALETFLALLKEEKLLVAAQPEAPPGRLEEGDSMLVQWDFHDLLFHTRSRRGRQRGPFGGYFPYVGAIDPQPVVRPPWEGEEIPLEKPDLEELIRSDPPLSAVQTQRVSVRQYDEENPISVAQLGHFLFRCARVMSKSSMTVQGLDQQETGMEFSRRPYPNGGASYELELYLTVANCAGLQPGLYHYDPDKHSLTRLRDMDGELQLLLEDAWIATAQQARGQVLITIAARFQRVSWKYRGLASTVIMRNTGVLYQTMYLVATAMGLAPCGIGSGNSWNFEKLTQLDPVCEGPVGEFLIGSRPPQDSP